MKNNKFFPKLKRFFKRILLDFWFQIIRPILCIISVLGLVAISLYGFGYLAEFIISRPANEEIHSFRFILGFPSIIVFFIIVAFFAWFIEYCQRIWRNL